MEFKKKHDFEKIFSYVERRKLFEALLETQENIVCKPSSLDGIVNMRVSKVEELNTKVARVTAFHNAGQELEVSRQAGVAQFQNGEDRYFFQTTFDFSKKVTFFDVDFDIYLLQRRKSFRVTLPDELKIKMTMTKHLGRAELSDAFINDISAGGVRAEFINRSLKLKTDEAIELNIHFPSGRVVPLNGTVRHVQKDVITGFYNHGVEFIDMDTLTANRMMGLTLDLQRRLIKL